MKILKISPKVPRFISICSNAHLCRQNNHFHIRTYGLATRHLLQLHPHSQVRILAVVVKQWFSGIQRNASRELRRPTQYIVDQQTTAVQESPYSDPKGEAIRVGTQSAVCNAISASASDKVRFTWLCFRLTQMFLGCCLFLAATQ
jgi:hypothetical protein